MGFFDKIFNLGKAYSGTTAPKLACEMTIEGKKYMLEEFNLDFNTEESRRHIPMYAVFSGRIAPELDAWITRDTKRRDGVVKFFLNNDKLEQGAVFQVSFYNAVCLRYRKEAKGNVTLTTLVLSARRIKLQEEEIEMI